MYKHNASSIKETSDKQFVSLEEKEKWDNMSEKNHTHAEYYNKEEIATELHSNYINVDNCGTIEFPSLLTCNSRKGFIQDIEITGNTWNPFTRGYKDIPLVLGAIAAETGLNADRDDRMRSDFIEIEPNSEINFMIQGYAKSVNVFYYDKDRNFLFRDANATLSTVDTVSKSVAPFNAAYLKIYTNITTDTIYMKTKNYDISRIESIGDVRDDGLYDISIKSTGKNILNLDDVIYNPIGAAEGEIITSWAGKIEKFENGLKYIGPETANGNYGIRLNNIKVKRNTSMYFSFIYSILNNQMHVSPHVRIFEPDEPNGVYLVNGKNKPFTPKGDVVHINIYGDFASIASTLFTITNIMMVVSNDEDMDYEEYKESITTIVSPCQLEKVGNVADRLFKRSDGVWCIEKKVKELVISDIPSNCIAVWSQFVGKSHYSFYLNMSAIFNIPSYPELGFNCGSIVSNRFRMTGMMHNVDGVYEDVGALNAAPNYIGFRISKNRLPYDNSDMRLNIKKYFEKNPLVLKYSPALEPTIIELDHISNFMIETFDGITNISTISNMQGKINGKVASNVGSMLDNNLNTIAEINESLNNINKLSQSHNDLTVNIPNGYLYTENTIPGYTSDLKIEGLTLSNEFSMGYSEPAGAVAGYSRDGKMIMTTGTHYYSYTYGNVTNSKSLEPNTVYTAILTFENVMEVTGVSIGYTQVGYSDIRNAHTVVRNYTTKYGDTFVVRLETPANIQELGYNGIGFIVRFKNQESEKQKRYYAKFTVLKGDYTNKNISTFTGLHSVGDSSITINNTTENLFPMKIYQGCPIAMYDPTTNTSKVGKTRMIENGFSIECDGAHAESFTNSTTDVDRYSVPCEPSTEYFLSFDIASEKKNVGYQFFVFEYDSEKNLICGNSILSTSGNVGEKNVKFKTGTSTKYVVYRFDNNTKSSIIDFSNIFISRKPMVNYSEMENYTKKIHLSQPLRSLPNGVCDTIEKINGTYVVVRRCGTRTLIGTEQWYPNNHPVWEKTVCFIMNKPSDAKVIDSVPYGVNDRLLVVPDRLFTTDVEKSWMNNEMLQIALNRTRFTSTPTVDMFKKWLSDNNITFVYELKEPIIEELDDDINIRLFKGINNISIISGTNDRTIYPKITFSTPINLTQTIKNVMDKVEHLERIDIINNRIQLKSTYQSDKTTYDFTISVFNTNDIEPHIDNSLFELFLSVVLIGVHNYNRTDIENKIDFYTMIGTFSYDMAGVLFSLIEEQHENYVSIPESEDNL